MYIFFSYSEVNLFNVSRQTAYVKSISKSFFSFFNPLFIFSCSSIKTTTFA